MKKVSNRKQSCFSCFHGRRIDSINNFAVCFALCETETDIPEIIDEPNLGNCPSYVSRDAEIHDWTERYLLSHDENETENENEE